VVEKFWPVLSLKVPFDQGIGGKWLALNLVKKEKPVE
jgi:hypothetical protein